jgi:glycosyltransferase involved in cell wall biosynthesis
MRVAIANWTRRKAGGAETFLGSVIDGLHRRKHSMAFLYETDEPSGREDLADLRSAECIAIARRGASNALVHLREWRPDIVFVNGLFDTQLEAELTRIAPSIASVHSYYGMCISGDKTHRLPHTQPCERTFGPACLAQYYLRRCGGLHPVTMLQRYRRQSARRDVLSLYTRVISHSTHVAQELQRHGIENVHVPIASFVVSDAVNNDDRTQTDDSLEIPSRDQPWQLIFVGRLDALKGGALLLQALPRVGTRLGQRLKLTFVGDGPQREQWESLARNVQLPGAIEIEFLGWLTRWEVQKKLSQSHLLVMPSVWPEPFGLAGPEAGLSSVPAVAFHVGGISEWLHHGINGLLADAHPPTVDGLADALYECLRDGERYSSLRAGARSVAKRLVGENEMSRLMAMVEQVASS